MPNDDRKRFNENVIFREVQLIIKRELELYRAFMDNNNELDLMIKNTNRINENTINRIQWMN